MTSQGLSFPRSAASRGNVLLRLAQRLIEADARARARRHLRDLPNHLRADAGLPPIWDAERAMIDPYLRLALSRRT